MITTNRQGSQIHTSSLLMTSSPHLLNIPAIPIGETTMGVQGKK